MKSYEILVFVPSVLLLFGLTNAKCLYSSCNDKENAESEDAAHLTSLIAVKKSLLVVHLDEGVEHKEIFNTTYFNECEFSIVDQDPNDRDYLKIEKDTKMLTSIALDREDKVFSNMLVPQIQVQLQLDCPSTYHYPYIHVNDKIRLPRSSRKYPNKFGERSYVLTKDINFTPLATIISIIIEDVNDNSPEFIYPESSNFSIGYPEPAVSEEILPNNLLRVNAVDKDTGLNSKIQYRISPNENFAINPETGEIYPFLNALHNSEELILKIYAVDRNGSEDGRVSMTEIIVKRLSAEHLAMLTVEMEKPEDMDVTVEILRARTGINFKILKMGFISRSRRINANVLKNGFRSTKSDQKRVALKAWIYAFDSIGKPIQGTEIEKKVSEIGERINASVVAYKKAKEENLVQTNNTKNEGMTVIILIAVIITLILLLIVLIVTFLCWYCERHKKYKRMSTPSSNTMTTISSIIDEIENHKCRSSLCYYKRNSLMAIRDNNGYRNSILKRSVSIDEGRCDDMNRYPRRHHGTLGEISELQVDFAELDQPRIPPDRRKSSVTFNSKVKYIDIDFNDDEDDIVDTIRL